VNLANIFNLRTRTNVFASRTQSEIEKIIDDHRNARTDTLLMEQA
jgi:hypothetical protein